MFTFDYESLIICLHMIIWIVLIIALIYAIINQKNILGTKLQIFGLDFNTLRAKFGTILGWIRDRTQTKEYFFYKNSSIYIMNLIICLSSPFMLVCLFIMNYTYDKYLPNHPIPGFNIYVNICISIFAGIFVNSVFFNFTTLQDIRLKEKNAKKILRIIARCCFVEKEMQDNLRKNAICFSKKNALPNWNDAECHFFDGKDINPQNFCPCCTWNATKVVCNSNRYFIRITTTLKYDLSLAYSMASQNKPSLMGYIEYMQINLLKFELMLNQDSLVDIDYLSHFDDVDAYFGKGEISDGLRTENLDFFQDIDEINKIYNNYKTDCMIYALKNTLPLHRRIIFYTITAHNIK